MFKRKFHRFCVFSLLALLLLSLTGRFLTIGDSFAVFRISFLWTLAFLLVLPNTLKWRWAGFFAALVLLGIHHRHGIKPFAKIKPTYSVYQKNLFFRIKDVSPVADDIKSIKGLDFVTLQEITDKKSGLMEALKSEFPYQYICPFAAVGGTAILSRWPVIKNSHKCYDSGGMTVVRIDKGFGPVTVISTHLHWPFPFSQREQIDRLLPHLTKLDKPVIIGGDFNMVPWSYTVRGFERASDTRRLPGTLNTLHKGIFGTPIDHVLGPRNCAGTTERRPKFGSDHHGIYARIACDQKP